MKKTISILFATTALTVAVAIPAWSAMRAPASGPAAETVEAVLDTTQGAAPLILVDDDDDGEDEDEGPRKGGDDDDSNEDDDDEECDDDDGACGGAKNPAPAGTVTPPENGLFGSGTPPKVQMN